MKKIVAFLLCALMFTTIIPVSALSGGTLPNSQSDNVAAGKPMLTISTKLKSLTEKKACKHCGVKHQGGLDFFVGVYHVILNFYNSTFFSDLIVDVKNALYICTSEARLRW